ncbi:MAG: hypothetical protein J6O54_00445 [Prevotella sp.]|nr:hypothetical protein [Prevotella sp.]
MKQELNFWLMVALMCGLGMSVASCSDDKNNSSSGEQADEQGDKDMADAAVFWSVVGQLTDTPMPDDWKNATYEPAIGQPDGTNNAIRIVNCADEESAAASVSDLLGTSITTATQSYTYQNDLVGALTYHKTGGSSLATVDVSIQQMPGLSQIVYKTPEQIGENASFKGTAYYRFGDVVKKLNKDGEYDYWICVRPCLSTASKTDSHWMTLSKLPSDCVREQDKTVNGNKFKHKMPKSLPYNSDHMQNMAEMVYAMTCPTDWAYNLGTNKGYQKLKYFNGLNYEKHFKYNNEWFFTRVASGWEAHEGGDLFQAIFGLSHEALKAHVQQKGFAMVYGNGSMSGNDVTLTVYRYDGTNLKTKHDFKATSKWESKAFDINALIGDKGYIDDLGIVGAGDRYWVARYATGETLAKGADATKFDTFKKLPNCEDVFVYNRDVDHLDMTVETLKATEPKIAGEHGNEKGYYQLGDIIKYNNRYYVCASNHDIGETARFITLNDQDTHSTKTFAWDNYGNDVVYDDDMASAETMTAWIANILMDDNMCEVLRGVMENLDPLSGSIVPESEAERKDLIKSLLNSNKYILNANKSYQDDLPHMTGYRWEVKDMNEEEEELLAIYAPRGYLLVDKMRYSTHLTSSTDHWVPYLVLCNDGDDFQELQTIINGDETQSTLSPSHFQWKDMGIFEREGDKLGDVASQPFHIVKLGMYWLHVPTPEENGRIAYMLIDFTQNWLTHPIERIRTEMAKFPDSWCVSNITSREITFTDDGKKQTKYQTVYAGLER